MLKTAADTNRVYKFTGVEAATVNLNRQKLAYVVYNKTTETHHTLPLFAPQHSEKTCHSHITTDGKFTTL